MEKQSQTGPPLDFHAQHRDQAPTAPAALKNATTSAGNVYEALLNTVQCCSLGPLSEPFLMLRGHYRRNV